MAGRWHPAVVLAVAACALYVLQRAMLIWLQGQGYQARFVLDDLLSWTIGTGLLFAALAVFGTRRPHDLRIPRIVGALGVIGMLHALLGGTAFAAFVGQGYGALLAHAAVAFLADVFAMGALALTWFPRAAPGQATP